jgi:3-dehydroquinate synthase II
MKQVWVQAIPWDKSLAIAAIESGADAVVVEKGCSGRVKELGRIKTVAEDGDIVVGRDVVVIDMKIWRSRPTGKPLFYCGFPTGQ